MGPLFGRDSLWSVRTRKRPLNIRTLDGCLRKARPQKFVSRKISRISKVCVCLGGVGWGRGVAGWPWRERLGTGWVTNREHLVEKDKNIVQYSDPLKKLSRKNNHEQLLLPCLTFPKPLTKSILNAVLSLKKICCLFVVRIVALKKFTNLWVKFNPRLALIGLRTTKPFKLFNNWGPGSFSMDEETGRL